MKDKEQNKTKKQIFKKVNRRKTMQVEEINKEITVLRGVFSTYYFNFNVTCVYYYYSLYYCD